MKNIGLFFGAGAEISYGLPSGGSFALDIFRQDVSILKSELQSQLNNSINDKDPYATEWLPKDYKTKRIHAFGKNEFGDLIESTIEVNRDKIISSLNIFDELSKSALAKLGIDAEVINKKFNEQVGYNIGDQTYFHAVELNKTLSNQVQLFSSSYFSAILDTIKTSKDSSQEGSSKIRRYGSAFLQLLIGAHGQELVQKLNQDLFTKAPNDIPIFDDIFGMFKIEYSKAGLIAMELLLEKSSADLSIRSPKQLAELDCLDLFCILCQQILDSLFCEILDYQGLIDSHFRYLFSPKAEWAKFTKMVLFLRSVHLYITKGLDKINDCKDGYYNDLIQSTNYKLKVTAIGTSNYNNIIERIAHQSILKSAGKVFHLNGSVNDYFNPYKNSINVFHDVDAVEKAQINVPFILTQSGLKPLTSVNMSRRYVDLYDRFAETDAIVVCGYGFNGDDNHINGLVRDLIEVKNKSLIWITVDSFIDEPKRILARKLRLDNNSIKKIEVIIVDRETRKIGDNNWLQTVSNYLNR